MIAAALLCAAAACNDAENCIGPSGETVTVVLTFDDGPLAADVAHPELLAHPEESLLPLQEILDKLAQRNARAVFFVEGPRNDEADTLLADDFADALLRIHDAGHDLGYHCMRHESAIWANPLALPDDYFRKDADLSALQNYIDTVLAPTGVAQMDIFSPIFRPPFGGTGIGRFQGWLAATMRGWSYHGFRIDSIDWTRNINADEDILDNLPTTTEAEEVAFTLQHLHTGVWEHRNQRVIDVLLHVNHFTAAHLDEWMDQLKESFESANGRTVLFDVPPCYLDHNDFETDRTLYSDLFTSLIFE